MYIVAMIERRIADPSLNPPVGYLLGIIRGPSGVRGGFDLFDQVAAVVAAALVGRSGVSAADTNSTLPVTLLNGRWCQPTTGS